MTASEGDLSGTTMCRVVLHRHWHHGSAFTAARAQSSFSGSCEVMYAKALSAASSRQS